jgi:hypothetical protein
MQNNEEYLYPEEVQNCKRFSAKYFGGLNSTDRSAASTIDYLLHMSALPMFIQYHYNNPHASFYYALQQYDDKERLNKMYRMFKPRIRRNFHAASAAVMSHLYNYVVPKILSQISNSDNFVPRELHDAHVNAIALALGSGVK